MNRSNNAVKSLALKIDIIVVYHLIERSLNRLIIITTEANKFKQDKIKDQIISANIEKFKSFIMFKIVPIINSIERINAINFFISIRLNLNYHYNLDCLILILLWLKNY